MTSPKSPNSSKPVAALIAGLGLSLLSACNTSGPEAPTAGAVRSSGETAPTDLQLLCAAKAAEQLQITDGNVLPTSSAPSGDTAYQVNLTFQGGEAVCVIDNEGTVQSIDRL